AASALYALVPSKSRLHPHPQLAQRWLTALDWFADGNREQADSIALVKLGTSLDVLANGGRHQGILRMASHILRMEPSALVVEGEQLLTLDQLVAVIYNDGRSQILHGNHYDRLKSFATQREQARQLASVVLVESILALHRYEGEDFNGSFEALPLPDDEDISA
ncbi:MAG TPA: hypothetical protein VN764_12785, partial [Polyangiaceae bacterium]|nr:hypothetical protein [Polyangiaceae bacterium]